MSTGRCYPARCPDKDELHLPYKIGSDSSGHARDLSILFKYYFEDKKVRTQTNAEYRFLETYFSRSIPKRSMLEIVQINHPSILRLVNGISHRILFILASSRNKPNAELTMSTSR